MKTDYPKLQAIYSEQVKHDAGYSVKQFCEDNGLHYPTARRYIRKPVTAKKESARNSTTKKPSNKKFKATGKPKIKPRETSQGNDWHSLLKEYLALAIKNPSLSIASFASDKGVNGNTLRRSFAQLRKTGEFDQLFDLLDVQISKYKRVKNTPENKFQGYKRNKGGGETAHKPVDQLRNHSLAVKVGSKKVRNAQVAQNSSGGVVYESARVGRPILHGGYAESVTLDSEIMGAIMEIDPLSIANELVMARAQYYRMQKTLSGRLALIDEQEETGTLPVNDEGEQIDPNRARDTLIFGYAPRLRELELSIASMVKQEQKRYADLRKIEYAELMRPHILPAAEAQIVIEILSLRAKKGWSALHTCQQIELMGAKVPAVLLHEAKLELSSIEPEIDDSGVSDEELDSMFTVYQEEQASVAVEWLQARREKVARKLQEAEDNENGIERDSAALMEQEAQTDREYDELAERERKNPSVFDDLNEFEVL